MVVREVEGWARAEGEKRDLGRVTGVYEVRSTSIMHTKHRHAGGWSDFDDSESDRDVENSRGPTGFSAGEVYLQHYNITRTPWNRWTGSAQHPISCTDKRHPTSSVEFRLGIYKPQVASCPELVDTDQIGQVDGHRPVHVGLGPSDCLPHTCLQVLGLPDTNS